MAHPYHRQNNTNNLMTALLAIAIIAAVAFGVYWFTSNQNGSTTINTPESTRVEMNAPDLPEVPTRP